MSDILIVVLAVIFVLGVAINIHEFGHYIVAKVLGMRIEAYSFFGLGPRIWGFKRGHTDYRISAIPLGAYVKLYGDEATASLEGGESEGEVVPDSELYELRPRWQKLLVMLGGPVMNILLALAIPFGAAILYGVPSMPAPIVGTVQSESAAAKAGIQPGDRIIKFDTTENPTWSRVENDTKVLPGREVAITVERGGNPMPLTITPDTIDMGGNKVGSLGILPDTGVEPVVIGQIAENAPAASSGLATGDRVIAFNGQTVKNRLELTQQIRDNKDAPAVLSIERNGERKEITTAAALDPKDQVYRIGIGFSTENITTRDAVGLGGAVTYAFNTNIEVIRLTGKVFGQLFAGERSVRDSGLAGPVGIVSIIAQVVREAGFAGLVFILGLISLNLGVFNLLPIPLLDGGQIVMLGVDKVMSFFGMTLSPGITEKIQMTGLAIILLLMVFVMYLDISKFF